MRLSLAPGAYHGCHAGSSPTCFAVPRLHQDQVPHRAKGEPNDGLVSKNSSHWGKVIKDNYDWNHLDEINQVLGTIGKGAPEPAAFYIQHANRLKWALL